jgi:hypothetical protein
MHRTHDDSVTKCRETELERREQMRVIHGDGILT